MADTDQEERDREEEASGEAAAAATRKQGRKSWSAAVSKLSKAAKAAKEVQGEGISHSGPHPAEIKRLYQEPASNPREDVVRSAVLIVPAKGKPRAGTQELVTVLNEYAGEGRTGPQLAGETDRVAADCQHP
jgi:hypothetical protein